MNSERHLRPFLLLFLASGLILGSTVRGQDKPPEAPAAPAVAEAPAPAATPAPEPEPASKTAAPAEPQPAQPAAAVSAPAGDEKVAPEAVPPTPEPKSEPPAKHQNRHHHSSGNNARVSFGNGSTLAAGQQADAVVSIFGSSTSAGDVDDAVVSVIGGSRVTDGTVGNAVVSILGNTYVNGHVRGQVVTVLGDIEFGPNAVVDGEVVCVGGQVIRDAAATLHGNVQNIAIGGHHFNFEGLTTWFSKCLMYARPLAFDHHLVWAWCVAFGFLALYLFIAVLAPSGVVKCAETLEQRPGSSLLSAVLTLLLTPIAYILLVFTIALAIGIVLVPLFSFGLFVASIFGKVVMLAWIGRRVTKLMGDGKTHPVIAVLIGGAIVLALYTVPIVGFVTFKLLGVLGLGVVVYTLILQFKASRAARPVPPPRTPPAPMPASSPVAGGTTDPSIAPDSPPMLSPVPAVISAATLPRAGFWIRLGASLLDLILLGIVTGMSSRVFHGWLSPGGSMPFWFAVYSVVMWATKGTTIGGIICGLKLVRLDDRPVDWGVAAVRALGGFLSLAVAGLGFIWVSFDDERQSWHDKVAGTTIVRVPKGTSLM